MSSFEAIILGIVQGLTEFLPVSSSGHLLLFQALFGLTNLDQYIIFNLVCHLGTLLAIFILFSKDIIACFTTNKLKLSQIIIGTLPLFPLLLILKPVKSLFNQPEYLGFFFLFTALLLYLGIRFGSEKSINSMQKEKLRDPLFIGIFQAIAILPGISRSGSTISGARLIGWSSQDAIKFSFLLAIPAILGGTVLELLTIFIHPEKSLALDWTKYGAGFLFSFIVGYFALRLLQKLAAKQKFMYFVWYCTLLGIFTSLYFNI